MAEDGVAALSGDRLPGPESASQISVWGAYLGEEKPMLRKIAILVVLLAEAAGCIALLSWSVQTFGGERTLAAIDAMALGMVSVFATFWVAIGLLYLVTLIARARRRTPC